MSKVKKSDKVELTKFEQTVIDVSQQLPKFSRTVAGRQIQLSCSPSTLSVLENLFNKFRKRYKSVNEANVLAVAAKYFLLAMKEDDEEV
ncbi:MAG: hypothetical protein PHQ20_00655 [Candidatus Moranbacteria bacterium]|nr:hypothetical protein [Candidatus Moranbacteria bacterium]